MSGAGPNKPARNLRHWPCYVELRRLKGSLAASVARKALAADRKKAIAAAAAERPEAQCSKDEARHQ
jgi:hypothetical protein